MSVTLTTNSLEKLKTFEASFQSKVWLPFNFVTQRRLMPLFHVKKNAESLLSDQSFISSKLRGSFFSRKQFSGFFFKDENRGQISFKLGNGKSAKEFYLRTQFPNLRIRQNSEVTFTVGFTLAGLVIDHFNRPFFLCDFTLNLDHFTNHRKS